MTADAIAALVAPQLWHLQGALMSGEVRDLGTAVAIQEGKLVSTCQGLAAGMIITAKSGDNTATAELTNTNDQIDVCVFKAKGAVAGLKYGASVPGAQEPLVAVFVNANGKAETRQVGGAKGVQDAAGPALEVRSGAPLPNGSGVFDSFGKLVAIVASPHAASEGTAFALGSGRIAQAKGTNMEKQFVEAAPPPRNIESDEPKAVGPKVDDLGQPTSKGDPDKLRYTTRKEAQKTRDEAMEKAISEIK
jgi:hypothetical protein